MIFKMEKTDKSETDDLHLNVQKLLKKHYFENGLQLTESDVLRLLHELDVHQLELEAQNGELRVAKIFSEEVSEKYTDLYNVAPLGYFTLSEEGEIIETNFIGSQMLGNDPSKLKTSRFGFFVSDETKTVFNNFLIEIFNKKSKISCDVIIKGHGKLQTNVNLTGVISAKEDNCFIAAIDITDRKLSEMAMKESETRYRRLFESAKDGILILNAETGKIIDVNPYLIDLLGYSKEAFINKEIWEFGFFKDIAANKDKFIELKQKRYVRYDDLPLETALGKKINVEFVSNVYSEGSIKVVQCNIRDITVRRQTEIALKESEEKFKQFFEEDLSGDFQINEKGILLDCNISFLKIFGFDHKNEITGKNITILNNDLNEFEIIKSKLKKNKILRNNETIRKRKNGDLIYITENQVASFSANGEITTINGYLYDITVRKNAETNLLIKNEQLLKLNSEKDKFFSIISHDLRGPFSAFLGLSDIIADDLSTMTLNEIQKIAWSMRKSASNLYRLLENLLQWSLMQRGLTTFVPETLLLKQKVSSVLVAVQDLAVKKNIKININILDDMVIFADGNMLDAIIRNLVSNAVKFTTAGGNILVSAKSLPDRSVAISIIDTGIGMDNKMISNLFRLDVNTSRKGTDGELSTGLGLIICKDFIEKHGGQIWVESEEGKGSTFNFSMAGKPEPIFN